MTRACLSLLAALFIVAAPAGQQPLAPAPPATIGLAPEVLAEATALLEQFVAERRIAAASPPSPEAAASATSRPSACRTS